MNTQNSELNAIANTLAPLSFPKKFAVELCAECNLACAMCHHGEMRRPKGVMPLALFQRCADQVMAANPDTEVWISFCGEPLLEPRRLIECIAYGRAIGLRSLNVNTNGQLLTPEWADALLEAGPHRVVFGVDAWDASTYAGIRVGGDRDLLYANIEHFCRRAAAHGGKTEVQVQYIFMEQPDGDFEQFRDHFLALGATVKARRQLSWGGKFSTSLCVPQDERIPCPWAITMMHVFWDGRVPRCPGDTEGEEGAGNAWERPIADLWAELGGYRDLHLDRRFSELPDRCQTCTDWMTGAAERIRPREASHA